MNVCSVTLGTPPGAQWCAARRILAGAFLMFLSATLLLGVKPADKGPPSDKGKPAKISWSERRVTEALLQGGEVTVTFSSDKDIPDGVTIRPTSSLLSSVSVSPAGYPAIIAGDDYEVVITLNGALAKTVGGTVHVRQGSRTLARPLNVSLKAEAEEQPEGDPGSGVVPAELLENGDEENTIVWDPEVVGEALFTAGEMTTISFSVTREIQGDLCVWLTPSAQLFLTSSVEMFPGPLTPLDGTETPVVYSFELTLAPPLAQLPHNVGGTVHLRDCSAGSLRRTYDPPLPIDIIVAPENADPEVVPEVVVGAANFQQSGVAPSQLITVFGEGVGPANLQVFEPVDGLVSGYLGDTQILFDGVAAPLLAAIFGQVNAVVPASVAGKKSVNMRVLYRGKLSESILIPVQAAAPSLFTLDGSGRGQGAFLNGNGTLNSHTNPARRGTIVTLFGTGGGLTITPPVDGKVVAGNGLALAGDVSVEIGGVPAEILWAGSPPGVVYGVLQINLRLPFGGLQPGPASVVVSVGDIESGDAVTVALQ